MKKALIGAMFVVGMAIGVNAQDNAVLGRTNAGADFSATSASHVVLFSTADNTNVPVENYSSNAAAPAAPDPAATPAPIPASPKNVFFGDRDDYRWQLGVGVEYLHFDSSQFNSNMVGVNTTLTYFTNSWLGFEGDVITGFGGDVYPGNNRAKIFGGSGGIRIGSRRARWEPWAHGVIGGAHLQPQTAGGSRTSMMAQAGIGVDFRVQARWSIRGEGDWVYTSYFNQTQNNFQAVAGIVLHF
jgi:opacity protein-like surface antigen